MDKDYLFKLTFAVYQASEKWPEKNLLKVKARSLASEILSDFILFLKENSGDNSFYSKILKEVSEIQDALFQARAEKSLDRKNFLLLRQEYVNLTKQIGIQDFPKAENPPKKEMIFQKPSKAELNSRQKKILEVLSQGKAAQVQDFQKFLSEVTKRTLRRDLDGLLRLGLVERGGEWNRVFYTLSNLQNEASENQELV